MLHVNTEMPDMAVGLGTMLYAYMFVLEVYGDGHTDNSYVWSHIILQLSPSLQASKQASQGCKAPSTILSHAPKMGAGFPTLH